MLSIEIELGIYYLYNIFLDIVFFLDILGVGVFTDTRPLTDYPLYATCYH